MPSHTPAEKLKKKKSLLSAAKSNKSLLSAARSLIPGQFGSSLITRVVKDIDKATKKKK